MALLKMTLLVALGAWIPAAACDSPPRKAAPAPAPVAVAAPESGSEILDGFLVVDGHNDLPHKLRRMEQGGVTSFAAGTEAMGLGTDARRMKAGLVGAQFWSVYIPTELRGAEAIQTTLEQIDLVHRMSDASPSLEMAYTADDVLRIHKAGRIASLIGVEGGHQIGNSLAALRMYYQLGARYMTLTHSSNNDWADSSTDVPHHRGLSPFGMEVVAEMNRLGMVVDLSHVSDDTMAAALQWTRAPPMCSHSSVRAIADHPRNVPDAMLKTIAKKGGIVMVAFVSDFISADFAAWDVSLMAVNKGWDSQGLRGPARLKERKKWEKEHPVPPNATLQQVADHIDYIKTLVGVDHVGLGSDFDGATYFPSALKETSQYPALLEELKSRGYSHEELQKIAGLNMLRVLRETEAISLALRKSTRASDSLFDVGGGVRKPMSCPDHKQWKGDGYGLGPGARCQ